MSSNGRRRQVTVRARLFVTAAIVVSTGAVLVGAVPSGASLNPKANLPGKNLWAVHAVGSLPAIRHGAVRDIRATKMRAFALDKSGLRSLLKARATRTRSAVVSLPSPSGKFQRFALEASDIMAPGLAARHPDIATFRGLGIDDPGATIHADLSRLGFHASVRSPHGAWYIDPVYHLDQSLYASYYGRYLKDDAPGSFVERDANAGEISVDRGYYHADDTVTVSGSDFAGGATITLTISDPEEHFAERTVTVDADKTGAFETSFVADPDGNLETHIVSATDGKDSMSTSYQVVRSDDPTTDPPTGDVLRTYRLALITDPGYATFFGGSANVTAAKVTLMNRVSQVYEDDLSIKLQLIATNDLLNLDTWDEAIAPNGPCGAAACFSQSQVTGCSSTARARFAIGQIIGASNYDIGHLALGQPGGGVANLGVVGRSNKAGGCTGIPTPVGDFYAIDYVAHEMGHQFSGNHPFNGNQLNCSGGNRNASTSVESGSGSSIMAYAGICLTDDLQAHSDPYFSERSLQEMSTYTSSDQAAINEVQTASLRHFGGGNEVQVVTFGPGYQQASTIQPLTVAIGAVPSATQLGGAQETGNTVTISTGAAGPTHTLQVGDSVTIAGVAAAGYNGTFTVTSVPTSRAFTYTNPISGLPVSGGGTITLNAPGLSEVDNTVTVRTSAANNRSVGDLVVITNAGNAGYNGTFTVASVISPRAFTYTNPTAGLPNAGGGTVTFSSPFQVRIGGSDSAVIGGSGLQYSNANIQTAINAIPGFTGTVTVTGAANTGFTVTYGGPSAGVDVPNFELANLSCGGCFASVEETNHGGANDSFRLNFNGNITAPITNGPGFTTDAIATALQGPSEMQTVSLVGYDTDGDSYTLNYNGADTVPITRGQNNMTAGIAAALQGGNEQQQVTLTGFNAANPTNSFQIQIGGNNSVVLGNGGLAINNGNVATAVNGIAGFAGTVSSANAANSGFTLTFAGASANTDVPSISIVSLGCSPGCTAAVRETVKGGAPLATWPTGGSVTAASLTDTGYTLTFSGTLQGTDVSLVTVTNGSGATGSSVETTKGAPGVIPPTNTATVAGFGGGALNNTGLQVTFGGSFAGTNLPVMLALQDTSPGLTGFFAETDKGGAVDNKGGTVTPTGDAVPVVTAPTEYTIPLRTPFALTGSATDGNSDVLTYSWEQNDRGGAAGTAQMSNTKTNGPLFAMFPKSGQISASDTLLYNSPGENHLTTSPTRVFPDLQQILDNNTNADTGACPAGPIAPPVPVAVNECFAEFLPTADYVGFTGVNASPLSLHFRLTARDGRGGVNSGDTTLLLASSAGPFLVNSPNSAGAWTAGSTRTVAWDVANTDAAPVSTANVKISLSVDGGHTYPFVLASSTPNDGSADVIVPNTVTTEARVKVEAVGNVFFDVSNADFTVLLPGVIGLDGVKFNGTIDSFDSAVGPYAPGNAGSAASLFSNADLTLTGGTVKGSVRSAEGAVTVQEGAVVTGDVRAGAAITNFGTINGTATPNSSSPTLAPPNVAACSPFSGAAGITGSFKYNGANGDLTVGGGKSAVLADGTYCFHDLTLSGGSTLIVNGAVKIFLTGKLVAGGGSGFVNPTSVPSNLQISSSFAGKDGVKLSGGSNAYLSVYAPKTDVDLSGNSPVFGALLGKTLTIGGESAVHYDVQMATVWAPYFTP